MHQLDDGRALGHIHAVVIALYFRLDPRAIPFAVDIQDMARRCFFEALLHVLGLAVELFLAMAARFAFEDHSVRHNVDRHAALDHADVGGGLEIDAAQLHLRDAFGGDFYRVDAFLRTDAGVSFQTMNPEFHPVGCRRFGKQKSHRIAVENQTSARA